MKLTIITPCSRPENLETVAASIDQLRELFVVEHVVIMAFAPGCIGGPERNYGLYQVNDGLVYFLDDDNIIHPDFGSELAKATVDIPDADCYIFGQDRDGSYLPPNPDPILGQIDTAQFVLRREAIGEILWPSQRGGDFAFYTAIQPTKVHCVDRIACWHNRLTWGTK